MGSLMINKTNILSSRVNEACSALFFGLLYYFYYLNYYYFLHGCPKERA